MSDIVKKFVAMGCFTCVTITLVVAMSSYKSAHARPTQEEAIQSIAVSLKDIAQSLKNIENKKCK